MKAIILSAGQGRRLLPLTAALPKCLVPIDGAKTLLQIQLETLAACGVREAVVMVGFAAERVEEILDRIPALPMQVRTQFNPVHARADNLLTAWLAREHLRDETLLVNGDTLFEREIVERMLREKAPIRMAVNRKPEYDDDDMKVRLTGPDRVGGIGKHLVGAVDGEAIGLTAFQPDGAEVFREALDAAVRHPEAFRHWYTSALRSVAELVPVRAVDVSGLWWAEIDDGDDLEGVLARYRRPEADPPALRAATA